MANSTQERRKSMTEDEARTLFYNRLTQMLHATVAEGIGNSAGDVNLIHILGQFKRFEAAIEKTAGSPQSKLTNYPE